MPRSLASTESNQSDKTDKTDKIKTPQTAVLLSGKPGELVPGEAPTFSLSSIQHVDRHGKVITDPDRSNPTRPRLERPLDTLRGFEAAINARRGGHLRE
ncbi:DUF2406 domain-containing protein [Aspergillus undulatus]|uniref:DUF2406 domain-containing protein n=1 Tax=Aspergillus undulatus TaxID=1810928 RepID=UPI003CCCB472